jgi:hypothetical protein
VENGGPTRVGHREAGGAFWICLDAINFGSGWWPTIRKRPGRSGYFAVAAGVTERFREEGPWAPAELAGIDAAVLGQDPGHPLMADFAAALRAVGARVTADHGGSFVAVLYAAAGSAPAFAGLLAGWDAFADASIYMEREVPSSSARRSSPPTSPELRAAAVDAALWHRGAGARYKSLPRPRCRCTAC